MQLDPNWQVMNEDENLFPGDRILLKFKILPGWLYVKAAGIGIIESRLSKYPEYQLLSIDHTSDEGYVWFKIKIVEPPESTGEMQTAGLGIGAVLAIFAIGASVFFSLSKTSDIFRYRRDAVLSETEEGLAILAQEAKTESESTIGGQVQQAGIGLALPLAAAAVILWLWKRR